MQDLSIRKEHRAGRITLTRTKALNALTHGMCLEIEAALENWRTDVDVTLIVIDAEGDKAFCAGGDIGEMYHSGKAGDYAYGRRFWRDEYRLNAKLAEYGKPIVTLMQGFVLGGGVGLGCHVAHRVVCDTSRIALPECSIGFVPDVGGSYLLARAPGRLGEYLGTTCARMTAADALHCGFADYFIPQDDWPELTKTLCQTGDPAVLQAAAMPPPASDLAALQNDIDATFGGEGLTDVVNLLKAHGSDFADRALTALSRNAPLSTACTLEMLHRLRATSQLTIRKALELEYRVSHRIMEHGDFLEGIRAAIIDKDKSPAWQHRLDAVPAVAISRMLLPLGPDKLQFETEPKMKIGFIGLGNMGAPMAANLATAGYEVLGYDVAEFNAQGVRLATDLQDLTRRSKVVITMLPNGAILRDVAQKIIPLMAPGSVLLDCSTVDVDSARAVAEQAERSGLLALDAPVSGGVGGAAAGTLTFMVGGGQAAFDIAQPLFDVMGQKAVHCGGAGTGQAAKICNNMILGVTMIATCEAFVLADKLGLSRDAMYDVVSTSSGSSWSMTSYCPAPGVGPDSPADRDYAPGFAAELMLKDLGLSQDAAQAVNADTPLGAAATELYRIFVEDEDGRGRDFSAMLPRLAAKGRG